MSDSAGIRMVVNSAAAADAWRIDPTPVFEIGGSDTPGQELFRVIAGLKLRDGRIVIANSGTHEIRFYAPSGELVTSFGRQGGGPGEFETITWLTRYRGDSIVVYDGRQVRITVLDSRGALGRTTSLQRNGRAVLGFVGALNDGTLAVTTGAPLQGSPPTGLVRRDEYVFHYTAEGTPRDSIALFKGREMHIVASERSVEVSMLIMGRSSSYTVSDDRLYGGSNDTYEIRAHDPTGALQLIVRRVGFPIPARQAAIDSARDARAESIRNAANRADYRQRLNEMPVPETMPAFGSMVVDAEGNLWVQQYHWSGTAARVYDVYSPDGVWQTTVPLPDGVRPLDIGSDWLLGTWRDELDLEYVRVYRVVK